MPILYRSTQLRWPMMGPGLILARDETGYCAERSWHHFSNKV